MLRLVTEIWRVSMQMLLGVLLPWLVLQRDLRRLQGERRARAWPDATILAAPLAFGPACLLFHFIRTRRSVLGILLGVFATTACYSLLSAIGWFTAA